MEATIARRIYRWTFSRYHRAILHRTGSAATIIARMPDEYTPEMAVFEIAAADLTLAAAAPALFSALEGMRQIVNEMTQAGDGDITISGTHGSFVYSRKVINARVAAATAALDGARQDETDQEIIARAAAAVRAKRGSGASSFREPDLSSHGIAMIGQVGVRVNAQGEPTSK